MNQNYTNQEELLTATEEILMESDVTDVETNAVNDIIEDASQLEVEDTIEFTEEDIAEQTKLLANLIKK
jgi:hypothetical protein